MNNSKPRLIIFLAVILFLGCCCLTLSLLAMTLIGRDQTPPLDLPGEEIVITIDREICYGTCPSYSVTIETDGTVTYVGREFVKIKGEKTYHIARQDLEYLAQYAQDINYFSLKNRYEEPITDLPTTTTSVTIGERTHTVSNYAGAPQRLIDFENEIDRIVNIEELIN